MKWRIIILFLVFLGPAVFGQKTDVPSIAGINKKLFWLHSPLDYKVKGNAVTIKAGPKTDMFVDPGGQYNMDNTPMLLFETDPDFVLTARIEHAFANQWDAGALVLRHDSVNWVKFAFEKDYTGAKRVVSVVTRGISDDCNSVELPASAAYYKIIRTGNSCALYFSNEGKSYYLVRNFQFLSPVPLKAGFLAQSPTGTECEVRFSEITYEAKKIKDVYKQE